MLSDLVKGTPQHTQKHAAPRHPAPAPSYGGGGGGYSEYDRLHYGPGINESLDLVSAGIGAVLGIAAWETVGPISRVAANILNRVSDAQRHAAKQKASEKASSELAQAIDKLSKDAHLIDLFKELEDIQKSEEHGMSVHFSKKSKEITAYINDKRKDMSFGRGDAQDVRQIGRAHV